MNSHYLNSTLNHSFVILDEAQNTTPEQMKKIRYKKDRVRIL